jgi:hypothetical protein
MMAAVMAALALAGSAACQSRSISETVHGGYRTMSHSTGEVRFTDDDRAVAYVAPGARLEIEEDVPGRPDRRVEYRGRDGAVERTFYRDGQPARPSADDEEWIARMIEQQTRENPAHAARRVERIYRQGGTDAVLDEIAQIGSDGAKHAYYAALLRQRLRPAETARALRHAGQHIASDGDKRMVLESLLDRPSITPAEMTAMLEAAGYIASDGDKSRLLIRATERDPLTDAAVREAFFNTAERIASDGDKSRVLIAALRNDRVRRDAVAKAVRTARTIASDGDKSRTLMAVPQEFLGDRGIRGEIERTMATIASDGDRARVAVWLARSVS